MAKIDFAHASTACSELLFPFFIFGFRMKKARILLSDFIDKVLTQDKSISEVQLDDFMAGFKFKISVKICFT